MTFGNNSIFPFNKCNNNELIDINNSHRYIPSIDKPVTNLPNHIISEQANRVSGINSHENECEVNLTNLSSCEYYSIVKFHDLISKNNSHNVNIFHNNLNGLETKFDQFHNFLSNNPTDLDIITITETSQQINNVNFKTNIKLEGYEFFSTPTNTSRGGVAIYTKSKFDVIERPDLDIINDHYESIWIETRTQ